MVEIKKAKFIACPEYDTTPVRSPWGSGFYTNKGVDLEPRNNVSSFIKTFSVNKKVVSAVVRATALGVFELFVNGSRVGDGTGFDELKPTNTDYRLHLVVFTYDITGMLGENNTIVAEVSPGWRSGRISFGYYPDADTAVICEVEITYEDGTSEIIATDESWLSTTDNPIRTADIYDGWYYDARIIPVYNDYSDKNLVPAVVYEKNTAELIGPMCENVRIDESLTRSPLTATVHSGTKPNGTTYGEIVVVSKKIGSGCEKLTLKKGESVILDMGQNMVGRPRVELRAKEGTVVRGYVAELLNDSGDEARGNDGPKGSIYIKNYRSAIARIYYIANESDVQTIDPLHVFYGFRYFEITADDDIEILSVKGLVMKSDLEQTGTFSCSDAEINKLFSNIVWGARGNYLSIPTDCPQRDERFGWTGDTQVFAATGAYLMNTKRFLEKWLCDIRDSQHGYNGAYCCVAPRVFKNEGGNAAWADAGIIVPDVLYRMFGDVSILRDHFTSMCDYLDYVQNKNGLDGPNTAYGDWLNYEVTDKRYIAVCYYALDTALMVKFCNILAENYPEDAAIYNEKKAYFTDLNEKIKKHYLKKYFRKGDLKKDMRTQTTYLLGLAFGLIPDEHRPAAIKALQKKIIDNNYTLSTGFVGTGVLAETLQSVGLSDLVYDLLLQTNDPSWLYSVRQGATTVWERWNSYTKAAGFGDVSMNSFNHYAYGAVAQWFFDGMCGIKPCDETPGFKKFILAPTPDMRKFIPDNQERITHAEASFKSPCGLIKSSWCIENGCFVYRFTIPEGTTAKVCILTGTDVVSINDTDFTKDELSAERNDGRLCFELSAGIYTIK